MMPLMKEEEEISWKIEHCDDDPKYDDVEEGGGNKYAN
jgi:hypothetical protein